MTLDGGWRTVRYAPTRPLPTYLLAVAVGPLDVVVAPPMPATNARPREVPLRGGGVHGAGGAFSQL
jgi:alanyl aminopeptidase